MRLFLQLPPDPDRQTRFYQLVLQEDLLGGWQLLREWGTTGRKGTTRRDHFETRNQAEAALVQVRDRQLARGYRIMFREGGRQDES